MKAVYGYDSSEYDGNGSNAYGHSYPAAYGARNVNYRERFEPLLKTIRAYDTIRTKLETEGGCAKDLQEIKDILRSSMTITDEYGPLYCTLHEPDSIRNAVSLAGHGAVAIDIRKLNGGMPAYYLCRIACDSWGEYDAVVEDLYVSPGYPFNDERFVMLMRYSKERFLLRLSRFREPVETCGALDEVRKKQGVDGILQRVAQNVFSAAWHEDQRPGMRVAETFGLDTFRQLIELIYFCLSADIGRSRREITPQLRPFFRHVYDCRALTELLETLDSSGGSVLTRIRECARNWYLKTGKAFGAFLSTNVAWGDDGHLIPIHKIIYANFDRLGVVRSRIADEQPLREVSAALEKSSEDAIANILLCARG